MEEFEIIFYETVDGKIPVIDFIDIFMQKNPCQWSRGFSYDAGGKLYACCLFSFIHPICICHKVFSEDVSILPCILKR